MPILRPKRTAVLEDGLTGADSTATAPDSPEEPPATLLGDEAEETAAPEQASGPRFAAAVAEPEYRAPARRPRGVASSGMHAGERAVAAYQDLQDTWADVDASAAKEQRRQQKLAEAEEKRQQREAQRIAIATDKQNRQALGQEIEKDPATGAWQQKVDLDGKPLFHEAESEVRYDEKTGKPTQTQRDRHGNVKQVDPDANRPIGRHELQGEDDTNIYRKREHAAWDAIDPEKGIESPDEKVRTASAKELFRRELRDTDARLLELRGKREATQGTRLTEAKLAEVRRERDALANMPPPEPPKPTWFGIGSESQEEKDARAAREQQRKDRLAALDETLAAHEQRAAVDDEHDQLALKRAELAKGGLGGFMTRWQQRKAEALRQATPEEIQAAGAELTASSAALQQEAQAIEQESAALAERAAQGVTAAQVEELQVAQAGLQARADELNAAADAHNAQAGQLRRAQEGQAAQQIRNDALAKQTRKAEFDAMRADPAMAPLADKLEAVTAETEKRAADVAAMPDWTPAMKQAKQQAAEALQRETRAKQGQIYAAHTKEMRTMAAAEAEKRAALRAQAEALVADEDSIAASQADEGVSFGWNSPAAGAKRVQTEKAALEARKRLEANPPTPEVQQAAVNLREDRKRQSEGFAAGAGYVKLTDGTIAINPVAFKPEWDRGEVADWRAQLDAAEEAGDISPALRQQMEASHAANEKVARDVALDAAMTADPFRYWVEANKPELGGFNKAMESMEGREALRTLAGEFLDTEPDAWEWVRDKVGRFWEGAVQRTAADMATTAGILSHSLFGWAGEGGIDDNFFYQLGQAANYGIQFQQDPRTNEAFSSQLASGLGSTVSFMVPGAAVAKSMKAAGYSSKAIKAVTTLVTAGQGAAMQGAQQYQEARAAGLGHNHAMLPFVLGGLVGTSEIIPVGRWIERLGAKNASKAWKIIGDMVVETLEEAGQEAFQSVSSNAIAKLIYDKNRKLLEGVGEAATVGGAVGAIMSLLVSGATNVRLRRRNQPAAASGATPPVEIPGFDPAGGSFEYSDTETNEVLAAKLERIRAAIPEVQDDAQVVALKQAEEDIASILAGRQPPTPEAIAGATAEIADAELPDLDPPTAQNERLAAIAAVKLATGTPLDALTADEKAALKTKTADGRARMDTAAGRPIVTDAQAGVMAQLFPSARKLLRSDEAAQRAAAISEKEGDPNVQEKAQTSEKADSQAEVLGEWTARGRDGTTVSIPLSEAANESQAAEKLALALAAKRQAEGLDPTGELLDLDSVDRRMTAKQGENPATSAKIPAKTNRERWKGAELPGRAKVISRILQNKGVDKDAAEVFARHWLEQNDGEMAPEAMREKILTDFRAAGGRVAGESGAANYSTDPQTYIAAGSSPEEAARMVEDAKAAAQADTEAVALANSGLAESLLNAVDATRQPAETAVDGTRPAQPSAAEGAQAGRAGGSQDGPGRGGIPAQAGAEAKPDAAGRTNPLQRPDGQAELPSATQPGALARKASAIGSIDGVEVTFDPANPSQASAEDDGTILLNLNAQQGKDEGPGYVERSIDEEFKHAFALIALRRLWQAAGRPGTFNQWIEKHAGTTFDDLQERVRRMPRRQRQQVEKALVASFNMYWGDHHQQRAPAAKFDDVLEALRQGQFGGRPVDRIRLVHEFARQVRQAQEAGKITEQSLRDVLQSIAAWIQNAVREIQAFAVAIKSTDNALYQSQFAKLVRRMEAEERYIFGGDAALSDDDRAELDSLRQQRAEAETRRKEREAERQRQRAAAGQLAGEIPPEQTGATGYVLAANRQQIPSVYVALPDGDVVASHDGQTFEQNPAYPGTNTRAYHDPASGEAEKVARNAAGYLPELDLANTPSADTGPAVIARVIREDGTSVFAVVGGNSRRMMRDRLTPEQRAALDAATAAAAPGLGFATLPQPGQGIYRLIGTFDFRQAGQREAFQQAVAATNAQETKAQGTGREAQIAADTEFDPADLAGLTFHMEPKAAQEWIAAQIKAGRLNANKLDPLIRPGAESEAQNFTDRVLAAAALKTPALESWIFSAEAQKQPALAGLIEHAIPAAIAMRAAEGDAAADAIARVLANAAENLRHGANNRTLPAALEQAAQQMEMGEGAETARLLAAALAGATVTNKAGAVDAEASAGRYRDLFRAIASGVVLIDGQPDLMGDVRTVESVIRDAIGAPQVASLKARRSQRTPEQRVRFLQKQAEARGRLSPLEAWELETLERRLGQQFMPFAAEPAFALESQQMSPGDTSPVSNDTAQLALFARRSGIPMADDMRQQVAEFDRRARDGGFAGLNAVPPDTLTAWAAEWRVGHPWARDRQETALAKPSKPRREAAVSVLQARRSNTAAAEPDLFAFAAQNYVAAVNVSGVTAPDLVERAAKKDLGPKVSGDLLQLDLFGGSGNLSQDERAGERTESESSGGTRPGDQQDSESLSRPDVPAGEGESGGGTDQRPGRGQRPRPDGEPQLRQRPSDPLARNHVIENVDEVAPKGDAAKWDANVAAIETLRTIESEGRPATLDERKVLARYTGWGWAKEAFNQDNPRWTARYTKLRELLGEDEFMAARRSSLNAHFTALPVIDAIWKAARRLGFKGGNVLEPAGGVGHFFGRMPQDMVDRSRLFGVELDQLSGKIFKLLYPEAEIQIAGFQEAGIPNNSVDLAVSNIPFGNYKVAGGRDYPNLLIHDYFFARALDKVRPGGLVMFITSDGTMDKSDKRVRQLLAGKADLVGAIRLPNNAFKDNAGTEVTTDIIILRKKDATFFPGESWLSRRHVGTDTFESGGEKKTGDLWVNEYYANHPNMALGRHSLAGTMYSDGDYALVAPPGQDTAAELDRALADLPENILQPSESLDTAPATGELADEGSKEGSYVETDDGFYQVQDKRLVPAEWLTQKNYGDAKAFADPIDAKTQAERKQIASAWIKLRNMAVSLVNAEVDPQADGGRLGALRDALNRTYDRYVKQFGTLTKRYRHHEKAAFLEDDPEYSLLQALENEVRTVGPDGRTKLKWEKADIFRKRTREPRTRPDRVETIDEAINTAMSFDGKITADGVAELLDISAEEAKERIVQSGRAFENPETGLLEPREKYLSGNVREKLAKAESAAAESPAYNANVEALKAALPAHIPLGKIYFRLASRWIPGEVTSAFATKLFGTRATVEYSREINRFIVRLENYLTPQAVETYGTKDMDGWELLTHALNGTKPTVTRPGPTRESPRVQDIPATKEARRKLKLIEQEFTRWAKTTTDTLEGGRAVQEVLEEVYNRTQNAIVPPEYTGDYLVLDPANKKNPDHRIPGLSNVVWMNGHRRAVVSRILQEGAAMMAHGVGTGKTFAQIVAAMEMRRLGMARKPMIVVQKATIGQFAASVRQAYPSARILVATEKTFEKRNRRRFMSRIATGDYDMVIVTQPQFDRILPGEEMIRKFFGERLAELESARRMEAASKQAESGRRGRRGKTSEIEKAIERLRAKMQKMLDGLGDRADAVLAFEQLGVDALFIDEAHAYKKAQIITNLRNVKGLPNDESQRAMGLEMKAAFIQERNNGRNVILATGTPVTNTIAEAYIMLRIATPHVLEAYGIHNFDDFAHTFGEETSDLEYTWGGKWKMVSRFKKLKNGQELVAMIRSGFDVKMGARELGLNVPYQLGDGTGEDGKPKDEPIYKVIPQTPVMERLTDWIISIADEYERVMSQGSGDEKFEAQAIPIVTMQAGMAAALDPRLVDPTAEDHPGSKVNEAIKEIVRIYHERTATKGTQIVFADRFAPMNVSLLNAFVGGRASAINVEQSEGDAEAEAARAEEADTEDETDAEDKKRDEAENNAYDTARFNLYHDIRAKLIAAGIPEKDIAIIHDYRNDNKRRVLFQAVNDGAVRILIGSTEKLGVGVNVQERLAAVHHLDPPRMLTPAMLEQRIGRIIRQGNRYARSTKPGDGNWGDGIYNLMYAVEKSMDTGIFQMLENKGRFIAQLLMGQGVGREFEDAADDITRSMATMKALATGDNRVLRMIELRSAFAELTSEREGFENAKAETAVKLADFRRQLEYFDTITTPRRKAEAAWFTENFPKDGPIALEVDGETVTDKEEMASRLRGVQLNLFKKARASKTFQAETRVKVNGLEVELVVISRADGSGISSGTARIYSPTAPGFILRESSWNSAEGLPTTVRAVARENSDPGDPEAHRKPWLDQMAAMEAQMAAPWENQAEHDRVQKELRAIEDELSGAKKDKPAAPEAAATTLQARRSVVNDQSLQGYFEFTGMPEAKQEGTQRALASIATASKRPYPRSTAKATVAQERVEKELQAARAAQAKAYRALLALDPAGLADAIKNGVPLSRLVLGHVSREPQPFNIRGAIIESPADLAAHLAAHRTPFFESLKIVVLDHRMQVIASQIVTVGTLNESLAHPREMLGVLQKAKRDNPKARISGFIISHNHPSGDPSPSEADRSITRRMFEVAETVGIPLIDHIITNGESHFSFKEHGFIGGGTVRDAAPQGRPPAKLPVLPRPDAPAQASWEATPASQASDPLDSPNKIYPYAHVLHTADPGMVHVLNLSTRHRLISVDRYQWTDDTQNLIGQIMAASSSQATYAIVVSLPNGMDVATQQARTFAHRMRAAADVAQIHFLDMVSLTGPPGSAKEMGLMEEAPAYGEIQTGNATITGPGMVTLQARTSYHGTPHDIDPREGFKLDRVGTGEGAQVYGFGLYFAENRKVAETYRNSAGISPDYVVMLDGRSLKPGTADYKAAAYVAEDGVVAARKWAAEWVAQARDEEDRAFAKQVLEATQRITSKSQVKTQHGHLYTVELDVEPEDVLDWDKPLSEQSEKVRSALNLQVVKETEPSDSKWLIQLDGVTIGGANTKKDAVAFTQEATGAELYDAMRLASSPRGASDKLRAAGIPGIRFLDQGSRGKGKGTYNYVIFDESKIRITHKNGERITPTELRARTSGISGAKNLDGTTPRSDDSIGEGSPTKPTASERVESAGVRGRLQKGGPALGGPASGEGSQSGAQKYREWAVKQALDARGRDPRIVEAFGEDWPQGYDSMGLPVLPKGIEDPNDPRLVFSVFNKTATLTPDSLAVTLLGMKPGTVTRKELHEAVIGYFLRGGNDKQPLPPKDQQPKTSKTPLAYFMGGGGASGKTSLLNREKDKGHVPRHGAVLINADEVREFLPEYDVLRNLDDARCSVVTHVEASEIADEIERRARQRSLSITVDGTLKSPAKALKKMEHLRAEGYRVKLLAVTIDPLEAVIRSYLRGKGSKRYVPVEVLLNAHRGFNTALPAYIDALKEDVTIYDNSPRNPILLSNEDVTSRRFEQVWKRMELDETPTTARGLLASYGEGDRVENVPTTLRARTSSLDARHAELERKAKAGDKAAEAEAQTLVDSAAQAAGYTPTAFLHGTASAQQINPAAGVTESHSYTGTQAGDWTEPDVALRGAFYVTKDQWAAEDFAYKKSSRRVDRKKLRMLRLYLADANIFDANNPQHVEALKRAVTAEEIAASDKFWKEFWIKNPNGAFVETAKVPANWSDIFEGRNGWKHLEHPQVIDKLKSAGFDGYHALESVDGDTFDSIGVFQPSLVKSADPFTYDSKGKLIPLSRRFNPATANILRARQSNPDQLLLGLDAPPMTGEQALAALDRDETDAEYEYHQTFDERLWRNPENIVKTPDFATLKKQGTAILTPEQAKATVDGWKQAAREEGRTKWSTRAEKVVLSLFDDSGVLSQPWEDAGYTVYRFDIHPESLVAWNVNVMDLTAEFMVENGLDMVDVVLAQPPCTDFASSGARWFADKDADGRTKASIELIGQTLAAIEWLKPKIWALENPIGRIKRLTGLPEARLVFDPFIYGDTYTKRTQIWGEFNENLPTAIVDPVEGSKIHKLRGDNPDDKRERSLTPEGFAYAFWMANRNYEADFAQRVAAHAEQEGRPLRARTSRRIQPGNLPDHLATVIKSTRQLKRHPEFEAAKKGDVKAAKAIVRRVLHGEARNKVLLATKAFSDRPVAFLPVIHADPGPRPNALPVAYAEELQASLGGAVALTIGKVRGAANTNATEAARAANEQTFAGTVDPSVQYVIVDDTLTSGDTVLSLLEYVQEHGGTVSAITTLADGRWQNKLRPDPKWVATMLDKAGLTAEQFAQEYGFPVTQLSGGEVFNFAYLKGGWRGPDKLRTFLFAGLGGQPTGGTGATPGAGSAAAQGELGLFARTSNRYPTSPDPQDFRVGEKTDVQAWIAAGKKFRQDEAEFIKAHPRGGVFVTDDGQNASLISPSLHKPGHWRHTAFSKHNGEWIALGHQDRETIEGAYGEATWKHGVMFHPAGGDYANALLARTSNRGQTQAEAINATLREVEGRIPLELVEKYRQQAMQEAEGAFETGRPDLAYGAGDAVTRGVDQARTDRAVKVTNDTLNAEAKAMLEKDREGVKRRLLEAAMDPDLHGALNDIETRAAAILRVELVKEAARTGDAQAMKDAQILTWAYRETGTQQARALGLARRDPHKKRADRHRDFLMDALFAPDPKVEQAFRESRPAAAKSAAIESLKTKLALAKEQNNRNEVAALTEALRRERLEYATMQNDANAEWRKKVEAVIESMGITLDDLFSDRAELRLKGRTYVKESVSGLDEKQRMAVDMMLQGVAPKRIQRMTGLRAEQLDAVIAEVNRQLDARLDKLGDAALDVDKFDLSVLFAPTSAAARTLTPQERAARIAAIKRAMGIVPDLATYEKTHRHFRRHKRPKNNVAGGFDINNPDHVLAVADAVSIAKGGRWVDYVREVFINNILSAPITAMANATGYGYSIYSMTVQRALEATFNTAARRPGQAQFDEFGIVFNSIKARAARAWELAVRAWDSERSPFAAEFLNETLSTRNPAIPDSAHFQHYIPGKAGRVLRAPTRLLLAMDTFARTLAATSEVGVVALRLGRAAGKTGQALQDFVTAQVNTPGSASWKAAAELAAEWTFTNPLRSEKQGGGFIESKVKKFADMANVKRESRTGQVGELILSMFFPFITTPFRLAQAGLRKTWVGASFNTARLLADMRFEKGRLVTPSFTDGQKLALMADGFAAALVFGLLFGATEGDDDDEDKMLLITGTRPVREASKGARELAMRTVPPQTIRIGGRNGVQFSYARLDPFSTVIATTVDTIRQIKALRDGKPMEDAIGALQGHLVAQIEDKTFMRGMADLGMLMEGTRTLPEWAVRQMAAVLVPNIIRNPMRALDPVVRDGKTAPLSAENVIYTFLPQPFIAPPAQRDLHGREIRKGGNPLTRALVPGQPEAARQWHPADKFLRHYNRENPNETWNPGRPAAEYTDPMTGKKVKMTPRQYNEFLRVRGDLQMQKLLPMEAILAKRKPTTDDMEQVRSAMMKATKEAREYLYGVPLKDVLN